MDVKRFIQELTASQHYQQQIVTVKELPGREAIFVEVTPPLAPEWF